MASPVPRSAGPRWAALTGAAAICAALGIWIALALRPAPETGASATAPAPEHQEAGAMPVQRPPSSAASPRAAGGPANAAPAATSSEPSFDVVRVSPDGSAVLAGRAPPGSDVIVRDGDRELGRTQADAQGAWVLVPGAPIPPGPHSLSVAAVPPQGGPETKGAGTVVADVPARTAPGAEAPLAVLTGPNAPRVLQGPGTAKPGQLGMQSLDYDEHGRMRFAGTAPPGAQVRVYVDQHPVGEATANAEGRWELTPANPPAPGQHRLRLDQIGRNGRVTARQEMPFQQENLAERNLPPGSVVVQPGSNLWRIARGTYGSGVRYMLIFQANRAQIRDPNLIYPGQVFSIPDLPGQEAAAHSLEASH